MALGFSSKAGKAESQSSNEKTPTDNYDPERTVLRGKPMNRIDGPLKARAASVSAGADDASGDFSIGKQIEMEAENAIQYRTCSWPKVCIFELQVHDITGVSYDFPARHNSQLRGKAYAGFALLS
ncbi:hypothetical protein K491DRAFT_498491 [Lophiostoma macrostomum CBS 122681]|uniref:Uncharacterized protein n=1 Tax=Lophiostoma macrostomum CBS 122681 TaxID=1314788 RepID=A0A6A6T1Z7_9PLEO|nr:hypothetical protein K491DRAFT_498491 [Lophiostoma macrostomum CBS 122681]